MKRTHIQNLKTTAQDLPDDFKIMPITKTEPVPKGTFATIPIKKQGTRKKYQDKNKLIIEGFHGVIPIEGTPLIGKNHGNIEITPTPDKENTVILISFVEMDNINPEIDEIDPNAKVHFEIMTYCEKCGNWQDILDFIKCQT